MEGFHPNRAIPPEQNSFFLMGYLTASKGISKLAQLPPSSLHHHGLQVYLQYRWITPWECLSKLVTLQPTSLSLVSQYYGVDVLTITASKGISEIARSRRPSASLNALTHGVVEWCS
jgi:hypothetical protein